MGLKEKEEGGEGIGLKVGGRVDQGLANLQKELRELLWFAPMNIFSDCLIKNKLTKIVFADSKE